MENINKNTNEKLERLADRIIAIAVITGMISFCLTIALAITSPMSLAMIYSAITFVSSIIIGKIGSIAFDYYTPAYVFSMVVDEEK
jgi:hypothetical protein